MFSSPVKVNRRNSTTAIESPDRTCRKTLSFGSPQPQRSRRSSKSSNDLRVFVLRSNYRKLCMQGNGKRKQIREEDQKLEFPSTTSHSQRSQDLHQSLMEKTLLIQQIEEDFKEMRAKRQKLESEEKVLRKSLDENSSQLSQIFEKVKELASLKFGEN